MLFFSDFWLVFYKAGVGSGGKNETAADPQHCFLDIQ